MQALFALFLTIDWFLLTVVVKAEHCTAMERTSVVDLLVLDSNFASCQADSNYTLSAFTSPSAAQIRDLCSSSACQGILSATLKSNQLPDGEVVVGTHVFNLIEVAAVVAVTCGPAGIQEPDYQSERLVDNLDGNSSVQQVSDRVASLLGHSAPIEKVGIVAALLSLFRE